MSSSNAFKYIFTKNNTFKREKSLLEISYTDCGIINSNISHLCNFCNLFVGCINNLTVTYKIIINIINAVYKYSVL